MATYIRRRELQVHTGRRGGRVAARGARAAVRRIGVLMSGANNALGQARFKALQQGLEKLGWTDGRNVVNRGPLGGGTR